MSTTKKESKSKKQKPNQKVDTKRLKSNPLDINSPSLQEKKEMNSQIQEQYLNQATKMKNIITKPTIDLSKAS